MSASKSKLVQELLAELKQPDLPPDQLARMAADFYKALIEQEVPEDFARELTRIYVGGF